MNDERTSSYLVYMINAKSLTQLLFKQPEIVNRDRHQGMRYEKFSVLNICSCIFKQLEFYFRCNQKADHFPTLIKWFPVKFRIYNTVKTFPVYIWLIFTNKSSLLVINYWFFKLIIVISKFPIILIHQVIQTLPPPGHQGRRLHLHPQRHAHHQRAHGDGHRSYGLAKRRAPKTAIRTSLKELIGNHSCIWSWVITWYFNLEKFGDWVFYKNWSNWHFGYKRLKMIGTLHT